MNKLINFILLFFYTTNLLVSQPALLMNISSSTDTIALLDTLTPASISSIENWFYADTLVTTSGSDVTVFQDIISGLSLSNGINAPQLVTGGAYNYIDFDPTNSESLACGLGAPFSACSASTGLNGRSERTTIVRMNLDAIDVANEAYLWAYYDLDDGSPSLGDAYAYRDDNSVRYIGGETESGSSIPLDTWITVVIIGEDTDGTDGVESEEYKIFINGTEQNPYTTSNQIGVNSIYDVMIFGWNGNGTDYSDYSIIEFATWSKVLSTTELNKMTTYFDKTP